ncbi:MAG: hypothetical protein AAFR26_23945 [Cyanobacteria bacterium J06626_4]
MNDLSLLLGIVLGMMSLFTGVFGAIAWYRSNVRKAYAAERDFNHLKNNYRQLAESVNNLYRFSDDAKDEVMRELTYIRAAIEKPES